MQIGLRANNHRTHKNQQTTLKVSRQGTDGNKHSGLQSSTVILPVLCCYSVQATLSRLPKGFREADCAWGWSHAPALPQSNGTMIGCKMHYRPRTCLGLHCYRPKIAEGEQMRAGQCCHDWDKHWIHWNGMTNWMTRHPLLLRSWSCSPKHKRNICNTEDSWWYIV